MFIKQADIFWGIDHDFVKDIFDQSKKETHDKGDVLFKEGDPADTFFILTKGLVDISTGSNQEVVHVVNHPGEAFGWSCLVEREKYSASAECMEPTLLIRIDKKVLEDAIERDPKNGLIFYKHLAHSIGDRLVHSYHQTASEIQSIHSESCGTGQMSMAADDM